ncbi:MAG: AraC family ligand binding domain-containing protein, partial [Eubacteriales bacterium]
MVYSHNLTLHLRASDYAKHFHNDCEFLYFIDGAGDYVVEERRYRVTSGDLMLIPPGKYHFLDAPDGRRYERFVLHASPAFFSDP